jgi:probable HAF family extracellular repeat protein
MVKLSEIKIRGWLTCAWLSLVLSLIAVLPITATGQQLNPLRYRVIDLGTLQDGPFSNAISLTDDGLKSGFSILPDGSQHAVLWRLGAITDLGNPGLGGPNSAAYGINRRGQVSGLAETADSDPNGEDFCGFGTHLVCRPFVWDNGIMSSLQTLGGNNGEAGLINHRGEIAGNAENKMRDRTCPSGGPQVFEEKPVIWENGEVHELPTAPGDLDGWAFGINDRGQVVGASGECSQLNPATGVYILSRHALLWDRERAIDLGNLGGTGSFGPGNIGLEINNYGQVVGTSDLAGDTTYHAFLWTEDAGIHDLGTLPGDFASAGLGINDWGEVVGASFDANFNPRAFLRLDRRMIDLNTLAPNSPLYLLFAHGINSRGEIVGFGANGLGDIHAFLAIPYRTPALSANKEP